MLAEAENLWAPSDHPIFHVVPPAINAHLCLLYAAIGGPEVDHKTFWDVYTALLEVWDSEDETADRQVHEELEAQANAPDAGEDQGVPDMLAGLKPIQFGVDGVPDMIAVDCGNEGDEHGNSNEGGE